MFFNPKNVFDPMSGSGTCCDFCKELGIPCYSGDIKNGFDAGNLDLYADLVKDCGFFDFIWLHPPRALKVE